MTEEEEEEEEEESLRLARGLIMNYPREPAKQLAKLKSPESETP